jgi:SAM-dependent methyltransferase
MPHHVLEMFKRQRAETPGAPDGVGEAPHRSHIFPKFLKRLSAIDRPTVLDLGRLTGGNIEILTRLGCKVQVDDLVSAADERAAARETAEGRGAQAPGTGVTAVAEVPGAAAPPTGAGSVLAEPAIDAATAPVAATTSAAPRLVQAAGSLGPAGTIGRSGAAAGSRPSRHIVLPPRQFGRSTAAPGAANAARATAPEPTPLSAAFSYADGSFDAILAWDLINYYDPQSARRLAGEIGRILKPGGLVYGWIHSKPLHHPDGPRRFRIVDETKIQEEPFAGRAIPRHIYQNRDLQKMFTDQRIVEMYFLKNGVREMLMEKRAPGSAPPPGTPIARPSPRFRVE